MRREASLAASIKFRGEKNVDEVNKVLKRKNILKEVKFAQDHPDSELCKQLDKEFLPIISQTGRKMSFHPEERKNAPMYVYNVFHQYCIHCSLHTYYHMCAEFDMSIF